MIVIRSRWVVSIDGTLTSGSPEVAERELSSRLAIHRPPLRLGHVTCPHIRFIEVWLDGEHSARQTFTLDETPPIELLIRTLAPIHVTGPGVDLDLDPHQIALLRCNAESWAVLDQPETVSGPGHSAANGMPH